MSKVGREQTKINFFQCSIGHFTWRPCT